MQQATDDVLLVTTVPVSPAGGLQAMGEAVDGKGGVRAARAQPLKVIEHPVGQGRGKCAIRLLVGQMVFPGGVAETSPARGTGIDMLAHMRSPFENPTRNIMARRRCRYRN